MATKLQPKKSIIMSCDKADVEALPWEVTGPVTAYANIDDMVLSKNGKHLGFSIRTTATKKHPGGIMIYEKGLFENVAHEIVDKHNAAVLRAAGGKWKCATDSPKGCGGGRYGDSEYCATHFARWTQALKEAR